ncbi:MAG: hypothetical protein Q9181_008082, partial [Wetmoreana brouardii]
PAKLSRISHPNKRLYRPGNEPPFQPPRPVPRHVDLTDEDKQIIDANDAEFFRFDAALVAKTGDSLGRHIVNLLLEDFKDEEREDPEMARWENEKTKLFVLENVQIIIDAWVHELTLVEVVGASREEKAKLRYLTAKRKEYGRLWKAYYLTGVGEIFRDWLNE